MAKKNPFVFGQRVMVPGRSSSRIVTEVVDAKHIRVLDIVEMTDRQRADWTRSGVKGEFKLIPGMVVSIEGLAISAQSQEVGSVSSSFRVFGPNDKIVVTAYDDPRVDGVTCYVSAAKTGGIGGAIGWSEDTSDASIACRGVGPITLKGTLPDQEEVLKFVFE